MFWFSFFEDSSDLENLSLVNTEWTFPLLLFPWWLTLKLHFLLDASIFTRIVKEEEEKNQLKVFLNDCALSRSSHPEVLLVRDVLKICSKLTGEHPYRSVTYIKLLRNFIEITLRHGCSPVNLLHIFRTPVTRNTSEWLLLFILTIALSLFGFWVIESQL